MTKGIGPLSNIEITKAVETEGYPFEIRVFEKLVQLGLDPGFSLRIPSGEDLESKETDVLAHLDLVVKRPKSVDALAVFSIVAEAKRLHEGCFVGFTTEDIVGDPLDASLTRMRLPLGGLPSYGILGGQFEPSDEVIFGNDKNHINSALTHLVRDAPYCVQWGQPRRNKNNDRPILANQEESTRRDVFSTVRGAHWLAHGTTMRRLKLSTKVAPLPQLVLALPVLVLDAPIYTYSAAKKILTPVHRLLLRVSTESILGRDAPIALVDVVDLDGLTELAERLREAHAQLETVLSNVDYTTIVGAAGIVQHEKWAEKEAAERYAKTGPAVFRPA